jgi:ADP-heptose:LPS heptosyltransferase
MNSIFHITGGLGKHILSSSVVNSFKHTYPDKNIIISSSYPDIFSNNPNVTESLSLNRNQYFYKNYIFEKDCEIFAQEPYKQTTHIKKEKHLISTWCDMLNIPNISPPTLHINFREHERVAELCSKYNDKPILVFQPFGGPQNQLPYCWARDIHPSVAQYLVDNLSKKYHILHICNPHHPKLNNCIRIDDRLSPNTLFAILQFSTERILIDSCLQHAAFALNLPSIVFWVATAPDLFGYDLHKNILPKSIESNGHINSYLFDYEISGNIPECPYMNPQEIYDQEKLDNIISYLSK